jgi:hypothetical protein
MKMALALAACAVTLVLIGLGVMLSMRRSLEVTQEQFDQLEPGMPYDKVALFLGRKGEPTKRPEHYLFLSSLDTLREFLESDNYVWINSDGSGILLTFDDKEKLVNTNVPCLDKPGIMTTEIESNADGKVTNRDALEPVLGDKTDEYVRLYEVILKEDPDLLESIP